MNKIPDVSVITATFNLLKNNRKERMLKCLESIHAQTGCRVEHIIIDGGSTDGTLDFLKPYEEKGWIKLYSEPDKGIYDAFNKGVKKASGEYVCFINSDDYLQNSKGLATAVSYLKQTNADFSYSPVGYELQGKVAQTDEAVLNICNVFYDMPGSHQGMVFKKDLFSKIGYHSLDFLICADYDFILRAILHQATFVKVPLMYAVFSLEGLTGNNPTKIKHESITIKANNYGISFAQAEQIQNLHYIPWKMFVGLLQKTSIKNKLPYILLNLKNMPLLKRLKQLRYLFLKIRTRKGRRAFRLFGINFIQEEKK